MKIKCTFCDWEIDTDKVEEKDISKIKCHYCMRTDMVTMEEYELFKEKEREIKIAQRNM